MKLNLTLLLLTLMALVMVSHALTIDKRGEDEDEPDEDEPDENEGGPPPPPVIHRPPSPPKAKTVIEQAPKPTPVVAVPPTKAPQEHHEDHSSPKKVKPEPEVLPKQNMPALPSAQDEEVYPTSIATAFTYSAATSTNLLVPTLSTELPTSSLVMPESTDLPPLGISSNANLSFFTPSSATIATIALGSSMMVSFWL